MDILNQSKLSRSEWESIEMPVSVSEKQIIQMIHDGYLQVNVKKNYTPNMISFTKLEASPEFDLFLYNKYFKEVIQGFNQKYKLEFAIQADTTLKRLKSADSIRIQNVDAHIQQNKQHIFEWMLLNLCKDTLKGIAKNKMFEIHVYTLIQWRKSNIPHTNTYVLQFVDKTIQYGAEKSSIQTILTNGVSILEKNPLLFQCEDMSLFKHQKELFSFCRNHQNESKLILYTAPTGTGKTLSPIGLSQSHRILFVCVARHVGLALAKSAISIGKKVAFAFGCETASDIRLHYFAAVDYEINKRSGGIGKVDNSNGTNVEIMICDVQSYLCAMYFMLAFNKPEAMLTYWDEPTMTLDYEEHSLHPIIHNNWVQNQIPNLVFSCATLPLEEEIQDTIQHFKSTFFDAVVHTITSYDCRKSISIINKEGYCFMPHIHCDSLEQLQQYAAYCKANKTLLRYFDLQEVLNFIEFVNDRGLLNERYRLQHFFSEISDITMDSLKLYYLELLGQMNPLSWEAIQELKEKQKPKYYPNKSPKEQKDEIVHLLKGMLLTTSDAWTLTDGPTIYLADNVSQLSQFYAQQSRIPEITLQRLLRGIARNEELQKQIDAFEEELNKKVSVKSLSEDTGKKGQNREREGKDSSCEILKDNLEQLRKQFIYMSLDNVYIPNSSEHQNTWSPDKTVRSNAFSPIIEEHFVKKVMEMDIERSFKILVLLGIGVLVKQANPRYEEMVKILAQEQKLFLIITSSDFIYGTNYQFCHGFIGKDLHMMTPQKTLQAMGRVGRNKTQQEYSVRFRDDQMIHRLFVTPETNREAINMNQLFCGKEA
jgi:hypothetical protein